jgi:hypothetical protein
MFWKEIAIVLAIFVLVGGIYYQGYQHGGRACEEKWFEIEQERIAAINKRVDEIKTTSEDIAKIQEAHTVKIAENIDKIIEDLKNNKSGTTLPIPIKGGTVVNHNVYTTIKECKPSDAYIATWNKISKEANAKAKDVLGIK